MYMFYVFAFLVLMCTFGRLQCLRYYNAAGVAAVAAAALCSGVRFNCTYILIKLHYK